MFSNFVALSPRDFTWSFFKPPDEVTVRWEWEEFLCWIDFSFSILTRRSGSNLIIPFIIYLFIRFRLYFVHQQGQVRPWAILYLIFFLLENLIFYECRTQNYLNYLKVFQACQTKNGQFITIDTKHRLGSIEPSKNESTFIWLDWEQIFFRCNKTQINLDQNCLQLLTFFWSIFFIKPL